MELWHWKECKVNMSVISYWYAMPGASDTFKPITASDVVIRPVPEMPKPPRVAGAIEGEEMKVVSASGQAETQEWPGVSNGHQLWWKPGTQSGGEMLVTFKAPKAGKYRIFGRFLKAKDYGIVHLAFNGQKAGEPIDFYNLTVVPQKEMDLGVFELKAGDNQLKATIDRKSVV